jgi:hypothetical protein
MNKRALIVTLGIVAVIVVITFIIVLRKPTTKPSEKPRIESEVFAVGPDYNYTNDEARFICQKYDAKVASLSQVEDAFNKGADWCFTGWVSDYPDAMYPVQVPRSGCGRRKREVVLYTPLPKEGSKVSKAGVHCYGIKPPATTNILPFNQLFNAWNQPEIPGMFEEVFQPQGKYTLDNKISDVAPSEINIEIKPGKPNIATVTFTGGGLGDKYTDVVVAPCTSNCNISPQIIYKSIITVKTTSGDKRLNIYNIDYGYEYGLTIDNIGHYKKIIS